MLLGTYAWLLFSSLLQYRKGKTCFTVNSLSSIESNNNKKKKSVKAPFKMEVLHFLLLETILFFHWIISFARNETCKDKEIMSFTCSLCSHRKLSFRAQAVQLRCNFQKVAYIFKLRLQYVQLTKKKKKINK